MVAYVVEALERVTVTGVPALDGMDLMSPFVWPERDDWRVMLRAVPRPLGPNDPTGLIFCGRSDDGLAFEIAAEPAILPGPDPIDAGGVEDPTVVCTPGGPMIFYTGVEASRSQGSLLVASGPDEHHLTKRAVALAAPEGEGNIKEATVVQASDGSWRLFYEYARDNASRIGVARADALGGDWTVLDDPFGIRDDSWDNWHLSTGPIVQVAGQDPVMFYNGATADARWRIGWVSFSPDYARVTGRGLQPILVPPPCNDRAATDIAFAASALVEGDLIHLWYSLEDRLLMRAGIRAYR